LKKVRFYRNPSEKTVPDAEVVEKPISKVAKKPLCGVLKHVGGCNISQSMPYFAIGNVASVSSEGSLGFVFHFLSAQFQVGILSDKQRATPIDQSRNESIQLEV
jgi:hypothetical protein